MSAVLEAIWERRDVRVDDWALMSSPLPTLLLCSTYFYIVKIWGPQFMRDRKPYELRTTLILYNLVQVKSGFFCCCQSYFLLPSCQFTAYMKVSMSWPEVHS
jgi:hypothetical protein